jgi:hydroxymethylglutaryl-CoA lyase
LIYQTTSKLLAVIANTRSTLASKHAEIQYLGFPFSISENFQMRNTHKTIAESLLTLQEILEIAEAQRSCGLSSMGFNPYGDLWSTEIVGEWTEKLASMGENFNFGYCRNFNTGSNLICFQI